MLDFNDLSLALAMYVKSIEEAQNRGLAEKVWETGNDSSLIYPLGWEQGWPNILNNYYEKLIEAKFRDRRLKIIGKPFMQKFDCFSIIQFEWDFEAVSIENGTTINTKGRESQIYVYRDEFPRLLHVHYSLRKD